MISTVKAIGSPRNFGTLAVQTRFKLVNAVIMQGILYNVEVVPHLDQEELKQLESMQHNILTRMIEVPISTPYMGMLLETGMWTMEARVNYKKLMLYHNIINSDEKRVIKKILEIQKKEVRKTTWYASIKEMLRVYNIEKTAEEVQKSEWKKEVKEKIGKEVEKSIRKECQNLRKTRSIRDDPYEMKQYLQETSLTEATEILKTRLHMTKLTCNYGIKAELCPLCGVKCKVETEHFFSECRITRKIAAVWEASPEDINGPLNQMRRAKKHLKSVEKMMERLMT